MLMSEEACLIEGCTAKVYAPGGTRSLCKEHFLNFVAWRRRRGPTIVQKYAAMTMQERDTLVAEWQKTVKIQD
jgi:hypothetical protein